MHKNGSCRRGESYSRFHDHSLILLFVANKFVVDEWMHAIGGKLAGIRLVEAMKNIAPELYTVYSITKILKYKIEQVQIIRRASLRYAVRSSSPHSLTRARPLT